MVRNLFSVIAGLIALVPCWLHAETVPYGHPDFYPSVDQPAQLRGDGSGSFPGASPVGSFDFRTKENIIWAFAILGYLELKKVRLGLTKSHTF